jgi:hypothetical protein
MSVNALSGHGTLIARQPNATPGVFTTIAELGDIAMPGLSRNEFDATTQNEDIDSYVLGVMRRASVSIKMNFITTDPTHDHLTGLISAMKTNLYDGYRFTVNPLAPWIWICSGQVQKVDVMAPVDGKLSADVALRLSGKFSINGVIFG